jgi:hypothetical protein
LEYVFLDNFHPRGLERTSPIGTFL